MILGLQKRKQMSLALSWFILSEIHDIWEDTYGNVPYFPIPLPKSCLKNGGRCEAF